MSQIGLEIDPMRAKLLGDGVQLLNQLRSADIERLRRNDLGNLNFQPVIRYVLQLVSLYQRLAPQHLESMPTQSLKNVVDRMKDDYEKLNRIFVFDQLEPNPAEMHRQIMIDVVQGLGRSFETLLPVLVYFSLQSFAEIMERFKSQFEAERIQLEKFVTAKETVISNAIAKFQESSDTATAKLADKEKEGDAILTKIKAIAAEAGVSQEAVHFKDEADNHEKMAMSWLKWTCIAAASLFGLAALALIWLLCEGDIERKTYYMVQLTMSKLLLFGTLSYFVFLASRNYFAHRHNAVVNRHRQNALLTFQTLASSAIEEANRDIILTKAAECIFSAQPTAYGKSAAAEGGAHSILTIAPEILKQGGTPH